MWGMRHGATASLRRTKCALMHALARTKMHNTAAAPSRPSPAVLSATIVRESARPQGRGRIVVLCMSAPVATGARPRPRYTCAGSRSTASSGPAGGTNR